MLLQTQKIAFSVAGQSLFSELDLVVSERNRLGLVGHNGSGKSTLLRLLSGRTQIDSGKILRKQGLRLTEVEQFLPVECQPKTVAQALEEKLSEGERWRGEAWLDQLGFMKSDLQLRVADLSGGQQNRLMFARALALEPELLLLDEPTNHLDLATLVMFEKSLAHFKGALILVSHDRNFLDSVCTHTAFLRDKKLLNFALPYGRAKQALFEADAAAVVTRAAEEKKISALRTSADRLATWGRVYDSEKFARRARSMHKRVDRLDDNKTFVTPGTPLDLELNLGKSRARTVLKVVNHKVQVAKRLLFEIEELVVRPGERIALLGHNGVGKSTFIRALVAAAAEESDAISYSPQTTLGYYDQELQEASAQQSMWEFVVDRVPQSSQTVRRTLAGAGFEYSDQDKLVADLSGGERARVLFTVLKLCAPNFLVLDEPTNHIDIQGKEQLEDQLCAGDTTLFFTSHDRRFLETVANRYLLIIKGKLREVHELESFFQSQPEQRRAETSLRPDLELPSGEDELLQLIVDFESLLNADKARKPKFQKPLKQVEWQKILTDLYARLEQ